MTSIVPYSDSPEYDQVSAQISNCLFEVNGQISTLQQFINALQNTENYNSISFDKISKKAYSNIEKVTKSIKNIDELVHKINTFENITLDKQQLISREKLLRDVKSSIQEFQNIQTQFSRISQRLNDEVKAALNQEEAEAEADEGHQQQEHVKASQTLLQNKQYIIQREDLNNEELAYHQNLIRERDQEINNIQHGIVELNTIFQDLSAIIQEQGQMVDNIEANIYSTANNTQQASQQLHRAMISQKRRGRVCIYLFTFLLLFLLVVILAL
ncbi:related to Syntaxin PEP12 [Saccharomycodes ludwigii]|uniref:Related to Syntaxin PEP12 n=1 Tax=Saccharomycodes ludwigii TaxID=36035 RepID=A0A376B6B2_9ASCO|nr:hypothetical protein SCDLUD_003184 [Saccharomycodes ludwigii]KAH3900213.1 hypothetical protein SCDLUD_003184 [Saccharomycodes ludwigii]SSD60182.1 related to Syntaxin PEP12 [Saccharomycodes ludwigii]